ncbi:hypothetical protein BDN67DRAFT_417613 [Paxillus ammoniavirescens]|nr:hypothetical protein BDN67DRAFT_417613 [Paxillus ammoniavirescens]
MSFVALPRHTIVHHMLLVALGSSRRPSPLHIRSIPLQPYAVQRPHRPVAILQSHCNLTIAKRPIANLRCPTSLLQIYALWPTVIWTLASGRTATVHVLFPFLIPSYRLNNDHSPEI